MSTEKGCFEMTIGVETESEYAIDRETLLDRDVIGRTKTVVAVRRRRRTVIPNAIKIEKEDGK